MHSRIPHCIFVLIQDVFSPIGPASFFLKFLKVGCPASKALFQQDGVVSVVEVRDIFISDAYSQITNAAAEDPVDGTIEESRGQYAHLTDTIRQKSVR